MKKIMFLWILVFSSVNVLLAQSGPCKFVIELEDFNFDSYAVGDTGYLMLNEETMVKYFVLSCEGDCYVQKINRGKGYVSAEGYYMTNSKVDTVQTKIFDPGDPAKYEMTKDYIKRPLKTGLWVYRENEGEAKKVIYREGKQVFEIK